MKNKRHMKPESKPKDLLINNDFEYFTTKFYSIWISEKLCVKHFPLYRVRNNNCRITFPCMNKKQNTFNK